MARAIVNSWIRCKGCDVRRGDDPYRVYDSYCDPCRAKRGMRTIAECRVTRNARYIRDGKRTDDQKRWRGAVSAITRKAVACGLLPDPKFLVCADCSKPAECYDHRDYSQPLLVAPVCHRCNASRRAGLMPQPQTFPAIEQRKAA